MLYSVDPYHSRILMPGIDSRFTVQVGKCEIECVGSGLETSYYRVYSQKVYVDCFKLFTLNLVLNYLTDSYCIPLQVKEKIATIFGLTTK